MELFSWTGKDFLALSEFAVPEAVTALCGSPALYAATSGALFALAASGKARERVQWRARGPAALAALPGGHLCAVQSGRVQRFECGGDADEHDAQLAGSWRLDDAPAATADVCALGDAYLAISTPRGVALHLAAADAAHGELQLVRTADGPGEAAAPAAAAVSASPPRLGRMRGRTAAAAVPQCYALCCGASWLACAAPGGGSVAVARLGDLHEQVQRLRRAGLAREARSLCHAHEWPGRDALLDDLRVELGVRLCSEVRASLRCPLRPGPTALCLRTEL